LRALEALRTQHAATLERERKLIDEERKSTEYWIKRQEETWMQKRSMLETRFHELEYGRFEQRRPMLVERAATECEGGSMPLTRQAS